MRDNSLVWFENMQKNIFFTYNMNVAGGILYKDKLYKSLRTHFQTNLGNLVFESQYENMQ